MRYYSIIIPVYNRPDEVDDLLYSLTLQTYTNFEVLIIEDGSTVPCETVVQRYEKKLNIVSAAGHKYIETVIEPTCTEDGYTEYTCTVCNETIAGDYVPATGHNFVDGVCSNCGSMMNIINAGETKEAIINESGKYAYFRFVPEEDGTYIFSSSGDADTYGYVYDENMNALASDDDGAENLNFSVIYEMESGETYYLGAKFLDNETTGYFNVTLILNPVASIEFIPKSENKLIENTNGYWQTYGNGEKYFYYYTPEIN